MIFSLILRYLALSNEYQEGLLQKKLNIESENAPTPLLCVFMRNFGYALPKCTKNVLVSLPG